MLTDGMAIPDFLAFFSWTNFSCSFWKSPKIVCKYKEKQQWVKRTDHWKDIIKKDIYHWIKDIKKRLYWRTSNDKRSTTRLVYDAVNLPLFHSLLDGLSRLYHRLRELLGGIGGEAEDVILKNKRRQSGYKHNQFKINQDTFLKQETNSKNTSFKKRVEVRNFRSVKVEG